MIVAAMAFIAGCATEPTATERIRDRMAAQSDQYRRVEVLPVWFKGFAVTDASLTTNDLKALNRQIGTNLLTALARVLAEKGYEVVQTSPVLCEEADLDTFDAETRQLLFQVRTSFMNLSQEIYANRPNQKGTPLEYTIGTCAGQLRTKLGSADADLLVLMESEALFESPDARHKRNKANWTFGAAMMPLFVAFSAAGAAGGGAPNLPLEFSPGWVQHSALIADARTREVLFCNGRRFPGEDARNADALRGKLKDTLADFAELPKRKEDRTSSKGHTP